MTPKPVSLYPLLFDPIYQYRPWGGRRLAGLLSSTMPEKEQVGEAWLLSDRADHASIVAGGALKGSTLGELLARFPSEIMGTMVGKFDRFPLLLKFLDVRDVLSVQVHPPDKQTEFLPEGESGKTEAWVVLETGSKSRIYAGLNPATTPETLRLATASGTVADSLASFTPRPGDAVLIPAGTVHSLCDVVVFEVQENSDVTFRLFDWNHIDPRTGKPRALQIDQAMACVDFAQVASGAVVPVMEPVNRERLIDCEHFTLWRITESSSFTIGIVGSPRVFVCISGTGHLESRGTEFPFRKGDVILLPAVLGTCVCRPAGQATVLEIALPKSA